MEIKRDCFAYRNGKTGEKCHALDDLYCRLENCKFYKEKCQYDKQIISLKRKIERLTGVENKNV